MSKTLLTYEPVAQADLRDGDVVTFRNVYGDTSPVYPMTGVYANGTVNRRDLPTVVLDQNEAFEFISAARPIPVSIVPTKPGLYRVRTEFTTRDETFLATQTATGLAWYLFVDGGGLKHFAERSSLIQTATQFTPIHLF